jgi:hypothetical protein
MRFRTWVLAGLTGVLVVALPGAPAISAGALPAGLYPANAPAPGKGAPPLFGAGARSSNPAARAHDLNCYPVQGFKSAANDRYVAAELGNGRYPGMLRARATHLGPWEEHQFCRERGTNYWSIFTNANQRWAITQINYLGADKGMLRAQATSIGPLEEYWILCVHGEAGSFAIWSPAAEQFVTAELGFKGEDYGMLRARASDVGPWEIFRRFPGCP